MRVLITGALGFIGSHIADALVARGDTVIGIDDHSGNVVATIPGASTIIHGDVRTLQSDWWPVDFDLVVHAASPVGAVALLERESIVAEIVETTQAVIRFCRAKKVPLINISSSEVYGFSGVYTETDDCRIQHGLTHRMQYAAGKLAAEHLVRTSGLPSVTIRPFNVAGPRQARSKGFVIPTFVEQAILGDPLTVFDGGSQLRSFTGVWDVVDFVLRVADGATLSSDVYNVGNPRNRICIRELADRVIKLLGSKSEIVMTSGKEVHGPSYEEAAGMVKVPDATRAEATGWRAHVELDELIHRTAAEITGPPGAAPAPPEPTRGLGRAEYIGSARSFMARYF